jgi:hypothetical protein
MNESYSSTCQVECLENGKKIDADVDRFKIDEYLSVYMNTVKVNLQYDSKVKLYIGKMAGLEFSSEGPKLLGHYR